MRLFESAILALSLVVIGGHCCTPMKKGTPLSCKISDCRSGSCKSENVKCSLNQPLDGGYKYVGKNTAGNEFFCQKTIRPVLNYWIECETKAYVQYTSEGVSSFLPQDWTDCPPMQ